MNSIAKIGCMLAVFAGLMGCEEESSAFVGKWVEQEHPAHTLEISADRGVYLVEETFSIGGIVKTVNDVARIESETALSLKNGLLTMTLDGGVLHYRSKSYRAASE